jgi:uncharacterized protein (UPF0128 family)
LLTENASLNALIYVKSKKTFIHGQLRRNLSVSKIGRVSKKTILIEKYVSNAVSNILNGSPIYYVQKTK